MSETRVRGVLELDSNIVAVMRQCQEATERYLRTVGALKREVGQLDGLRAAPDLDSAGIDAARGNVERLRRTAARGATLTVDADARPARAELDGLKRLLAGVASAAAVLQVGKSLVQTGLAYNTAMEQSGIAWATILRSEEQAEAMTQRLVAMAERTPFTFADLDKAAKSLRMAGFAGDGLFEAMTSVGDAVSAIGGGADELNGIATALFQIYTKGKLSSEEMLQLAERGIPAWEILAQKMGLTTAELQDMTSKGEVLSQDVLPLLIEGLGDRFSGAMAKQSRSMGGLLSTARDLVSQFTADVTGNLFEELRGDVDDFNAVLRSGDAGRYAADLGRALGQAARSAATFLKALWDNRNVVEGLLVGLVAFKAALAIGNVVRTVASAIGAYRAAVQAAEGAQKALNLAQAASPWGVLAAVIGAAAGALALYKAGQREATREAEQAREDLDALSKSYEEAAQASKASYRRQTLEIGQVRRDVRKLDDLIASGAKGRKVDLAVQEVLDQMPELQEAIQKVNGEWEISQGLTEQILQNQLTRIRSERAATELVDAEEHQRETNERVTESKTALYEFLGDDKEKLLYYQQYKLAMEHPNSAYVTEYLGSNAQVSEADKRNIELMADTYNGYQAELGRASQDVQARRQDYEAYYRELPAEATYEWQPTETIQSVNDELDDFATSIRDANMAKQYLDEARAAKPGSAAYNAAMNQARTWLGDDSIQNVKEGDEAYAVEIQREARELAKHTKAPLEEALQQTKDAIVTKTQELEDAKAEGTPEQVANLEAELLALEEQQRQIEGLQDMTDEVTRAAEVTNDGVIGLPDALQQAIRATKVNVDVDVYTHAAGTTASATTGQTVTSGTPSRKMGRAAQNALGTAYFEGGYTWVGERGPELVELPQGSRVTPSHASGDRARQLSGTAVNISIYGMTVREEADVNRIAGELLTRIQRAQLITA